jgi:hypothetical protein
MDKRGQVFGFILVFVTLFLAGIVVGLYYIQDAETISSLVSPKAVLEVEDSLGEFERAEKILIEDSLNFASGEFGTEEFRNSFRSNFLSGSGSLPLETIYSDLTLNSRPIEDEARGAGEEFLRNTLYPESQTEYFGNELIFRRAVVGKKIVLVAEETSDIHFPIDFKYEYSKEYRITKVGDSFEIR